LNGAHATRSVLSSALSGGARVRVLGEAVELSPATTGLLAAHPERVHLLPAADASLVGLAVGMALAGDRPVVELAGPEAMPAAFAQLAQEAAPVAGEFQAPVVVRVPVAPGADAGLGALLAVPGLQVAVASSPAEAGQLLEAALQASGPVVLVEPAAALASGPQALDPLPLGAARVLREGDDVSLLAVGDGVPAALEAAGHLAAAGVSAGVVDLRSLSPLDLETVGAQVRHTGRPVLVGVPAAAMPGVVHSAFLRLESPPELVAADGDIGAAVQRSLAY
jgi:pyruvate/2-oxoglutarate/acetoin dehydrogenase E1 component